MPTANLSSYYLMSLPLEHKDIKKVQLYSKYTKKNHYPEINITKFNTEFTSSGIIIDLSRNADISRDKKHIKLNYNYVPICYRTEMNVTAMCSAIQ